MVAASLFAAGLRVDALDQALVDLRASMQ